MKKQLNQSSAKFISSAEGYILYEGTVQLQLMLLAIFPVILMWVGWELAL